MLKEANEESAKINKFFDKEILTYKKLVNKLNKNLNEKDFEIKRQKNLLEEKISSLQGKEEEKQEKVEIIIDKNQVNARARKFKCYKKSVYYEISACIIFLIFKSNVLKISDTYHVLKVVYHIIPYLKSTSS